ncbi:MAG: AAA family ATPase [Alphaproteobacteria bacterium]|nr:AAA family ATPase [Alphaproteobacteria bacterium]
MNEGSMTVKPSSGARAFGYDLERLLRAQVPLIHINTYEESRAFDLICRTAATLDRRVLAWSTSRGVFNPQGETAGHGGTQPLADLLAALQTFDQAMANPRAAEHGLVFVLFDPYPYLADRNANPVYRRKLRDLTADIRIMGRKANCIILSPTLDIPPELEHDVTVVDLPLPTRSEIRTYVRHFIEEISQSDKIHVAHDVEDLVDRFAEAAIGLTQREIENALSYAVVDDLSFDRRDIEQIFRQKRQTVRKSGMLEFLDTDTISLDQLGGLDRFKEWIERRHATLTQNGRDFGLAVPKGVLLTGVPGCGKSWSAKCTAASWGLPLIRLDMGRVYSSLVGASEEHMRHAIQIAETVAPCVLWIDEIEKGLTRPGQHVGDSGVSMRVLGTFLTWMQEKTSPVFVFATANETRQLPPELLRKGRFDGVFFVDLPNRAERREIITIHLTRVNRMGDGLDIGALVTLSGDATATSRDGMTGAEIAAWVDDAMLLAYGRTMTGGDLGLTLADFEAALADTTLLARMRAEELVELRRWADSHARRASTVD